MQPNDRELLELAAKAVGYTIESYTYDGAWCYILGSEKNSDDEEQIFLWRPHHDDGDALRLAVKLKMNVMPGIARNEDDFTAIEPNGLDDDAATRRAIVRAAASIGKEML